MVRVLCVAEKPSVAKEISKILSGGQYRTRQGLSKYNNIYEFRYEIRGQACDVVFTSVTGHLMELDFHQNYRKWHSCDPATLFAAPVQKTVRTDAQNLERTLHREATKCQWLILWLDCDREGENIAFEVVQCCSQANQRLQIFRAHFSALIPRDIHNACRTLTPPDIKASDAVDARQELDLRIGAAFTRFQTLRLSPKFKGLDANVISFGPCQFPTLGFVVERFWEIQNFKEETFWSIQCRISKNGVTTQPRWKRHRLFDKLACLVIYEMCLENPEATVASITKKPVRKWRPFPLTTVRLQTLAAQKLRISAHQAMQYAEELYTKGFISYPRTETDSFQPGTDLRSLIGLHVHDGAWGDYAQGLLNGKFKQPKAGKHNDNSHPPIHPTKHVNLGSIANNDARRLYELVTRHFLACCSDDAQGSETVVELDIVGERFVAKGLMVEQPNYLEVYPYDRWSESQVPVFTRGEKIMPDALEMHEGTTSPPSLLTEAELIRKMDENGIGTDATIAQHIQTIQDRGYAMKAGPGNQHFVPTTLGIALIHAYNTMGLEHKLSRPELRAKMEREMNAISQNTRTKADVVDENIRMYKALFEKIREQGFKLDQACAKYFEPASADFTNEQQNFSACGKCGQSLSLRENNKARMLFCQNCNISYPLPFAGGLSVLPNRCPLCNFQVLNIRKEQSGYTICPFCYSNPPPNQAQNAQGARFPCFACSERSCPLSRKTSKPVRACPRCNSEMIIKQKKDGTSFFMSCKSYPNCKAILTLPSATDVVVKDDVCPSCHATQLVTFTFDRKNIPPTIPTEYTACIGGCNEAINDLLHGCNYSSITEFLSRNRSQSSFANYNSNLRPATMPSQQPEVSGFATASRSSDNLYASFNNTQQQQQSTLYNLSFISPLFRCHPLFMLNSSFFPSSENERNQH
ncbi:DNA topoisomerase 3-alpha, variant 2 [Balamuthia mandrillaris]